MQIEEADSSHFADTEDIYGMLVKPYNFSSTEKYLQVIPIYSPDEKPVIFCVKPSGFFDIFELSISEIGFDLEKKDLPDNEAVKIEPFSTIIYDSFSKGYWIAGGYRETENLKDSFSSNLVFIDLDQQTFKSYEMPIPSAKISLIPLAGFLLFQGGANFEETSPQFILDKSSGEFSNISSLDEMTVHSSAVKICGENSWILFGGSDAAMNAAFSARSYQIDFSTNTITKINETSLQRCFSDSVVLNDGILYSRLHGEAMSGSDYKYIGAHSGWECIYIGSEQSVFTNGDIIGFLNNP